MNPAVSFLDYAIMANLLIVFAFFMVTMYYAVMNQGPSVSRRKTDKKMTWLYRGFNLSTVSLITLVTIHFM